VKLQPQHIVNILLLRATLNVTFDASLQTVYTDNGLKSFHVMTSHQMQMLRPQQTWRHLKVASAVHTDHETGAERKW